MSKIIELYKVTQKVNCGDSVDLYDAHTPSTPYTVYRDEVSDTIWNDLKSLRKGSVYGLCHTENETILILGYSPNTKTNF